MFLNKIGYTYKIQKKRVDYLLYTFIFELKKIY